MMNKAVIQGPWIDDRTLDEMNNDDKGQLEQCYKKSKAFYFSKLSEAKHFMGESVRAVLKKIGIELHVAANPDAIDRAMRESKIKIEHRYDYPADESWRKGIYIYKNDELVAFISHPVVNTPQLNKSMSGRVILTDTDRRIVVRTNAWDVAGRLYQPPAK